MLPDDKIHFSIEMSLREVPFPKMDGPRYRIKYAGRDGTVTERDIIVQWINSAKSTVSVAAYCTLRGRMRSFMAERIIAMVDSVTGDEIANPLKHLRKLQSSLEVR
jgi:predicted DNA-binding transcriptional regulator YafY